MAFFPTETLSLSYKLSEQAPTFFLWASSKLLNLLSYARRISAKNYQLRISVCVRNLEVDGKVVDDPSELLEQFNTHFSKIADKLKEKSPDRFK